VTVDKAGIASGVLSMFRMVGGSLGIAVSGAIFQGAAGSSFETASPQHFVNGLSDAMLVSAVVTLLGAAIAAAAIRGKPKRISSEAVEAAVNPGGSELAAQEAELAAARS